MGGPGGGSLNVPDSNFRFSQNNNAYPLAGYDIFTPDGYEITDPDIGDYSDYAANAFFAGGSASWTGTGYVEYDGGEFPTGYGGTANVSSMDLSFYSRIADPSNTVEVTLTTTSISDTIVGDPDPMESGSFVYDPTGFGNPVPLLPTSAPDSTGTLALLTLSVIGLAGFYRSRRSLPQRSPL